MTLTSETVIEKVSERSKYIRFETEKYGSHFCVSYNVTKAGGNFRDDGLEPISLVIHATSNYMKEIEGQCSSRNWNGPISVALFVDRYSSEAVEYLHEVHRCSTKVNQKLSLHVVYRMAPFQKVCDPILIKRSSRKCSLFNATIRSRERGRVIPPFQIYPINVMRNVARKGALSYIHMMADVEMIFSEGFATKMKSLANQYMNGKDRKLLVIRRFEVDNKARTPSDHKELFLMIKAFRAFEFHHKYFPVGHTIESLWHWFRMSKNKSEVYAWPIEYKSSSWEAQLILHKEDPYNPEYFPTRIRDQQSLVYELCRANYTFHLASHVFNVHRGVKTSETNLASAVLTHQRRLRLRSYKRFMHYINSTYPDTFGQCGKFVM
uniref:I-beta-1,3-N-acetylglucosaminyltransferase n=1 Tax=Caenorhabditis japonica TaxID=281687 RepID=A0A8R1DS14_CAEJA